MLKVAHPEGHRHGIERAVVVGQVEAVALIKHNLVFQPSVGHLATSHIEHALAQIDAPDTGTSQAGVQLQSKVARAGGNIEQLGR